METPLPRHRTTIEPSKTVEPQKMKNAFFALVSALCAVAASVPAQDLAAVAAQPAVLADARTSPDGCAVRVLPDGSFMVFGTGSGTYDFDDADDVAGARKAAQLAAKAAISKFMKESVATESAMEEATEMVKSLSSENGVPSSSVDKTTARKTLQTIKSSSDALLQGVVALSEAKVPGVGSGGEVRVVCGVSSKTLEAMKRYRTATGEAPAEAPGQSPVAVPATAAPAGAPAAPTVRGSMPSVDLLAVPDGVAVRLPPDGSFMVLSAATASYDFGDADDLLQAKRNAAALAKGALAKFMKEQIASESAMDESAEVVKKMSSEDGKQTSAVDKETARKTIDSIRTSADALLQGVATLADAKIPGQGTAGEVRVLVGVSSKTLEALDRMRAATGQAPTSSTSSSGSAPGAEGTSAANGEVAPDGWLVCAGSGKTRYSAVRAALIEGVSMFYGESLSQDARFKARFESFKKDGTETSERERESESETMTSTAGFVRQYRVVEVKDIGGGLLEATVRALFVDPHAGGATALLVAPTGLPLSERTKVFQLGPKTRLSGADLASKLDGALASAVASANKFLVLTPDSLATAGAAGKIAEAMVSGGLASGSELLRACEAVTADYVLGSTLEDVKWTSKLGMDKASGRFAPQRKLALRAKLRLFDVRKASFVADEEVAAALEEPEIAALLEEDPDADLLRAALRKLSGQVGEWMGKGE